MFKCILGSQNGHGDPSFRLIHTRAPTCIRNSIRGLALGCVITELPLLLQTQIGKGFFSNLTKFAKKTILRHIHEWEREGQELNNRMCSRNIESDPRAQTFMLQTHPSTICVSACVKLQLQWSCDEPTKSLGTVDLDDFLVCARKKTCPHVT
jgi:hypothetical protein